MKTLDREIKTLNNKIDLIINLLEGTTAPRKALPCSYTLHSWLDEWLTAYKAPNVKQSTLYALGVAVRLHIKPKFPDTPLNNVNGLELQKFLTAIEKSRTREAVYDVLHGSFRDAVNLKLIIDNPMQAVKIPPHVREKGTHIAPDELSAFLIEAEGHALEPYFKFLLYTGVRRTEGLSLRDSDVDFENKQLHIPGTKTKLSDRTIPLFDNAAALLAGIKPKSDGRYFPFRPDYPTHAFKKLCPAHKLHDLRHTFATRCLEAKIPLKVVQAWLGHSEIDTTANIYSHVTKELNAAEAEIYNSYLRQTRC